MEVRVLSAAELPAGGFNIWAGVKWLAAIAMAIWVHDVPAALKTLVVFQGFDYVTGLYAAWITKRLSYRIAIVGFTKKGLILFSVMLSHKIELLASQLLGQPIELHLETLGAIGFALTDCISVVENLARAGVPIYSSVVEVLLLAKKMAPKYATEDQLRRLDELNHNYASERARIVGNEPGGPTAGK